MRTRRTWTQAGKVLERHPRGQRFGLRLLPPANMTIRRHRHRIGRRLPLTGSDGKSALLPLAQHFKLFSNLRPREGQSREREGKRRAGKEQAVRGESEESTQKETGSRKKQACIRGWKVLPPCAATLQTKVFDILACVTDRGIYLRSVRRP